MRSLKSYTITKTIFLFFVLISLSSSILSNIASPRVEPKILVLDGQGKPVQLRTVEGWDMIIIINAPDTIIENLVYTKGETILKISSDNLLIRNNTIRNAKSYALFVEFSKNVEIYNNTIDGGTNDGIISYSNSNVIIDNNQISGVVKNGIFVRGNNVTISNNKINNIEMGTGIFIESATDLIVANNSISNVDYTPIAPDQSSFDTGSYSGNTYNGISLTNDDINPAIPNTFTPSSSHTSSSSENLGASTSTSSSDETHFPFLIMSVMFCVIPFSRKYMKSNRMV